MLTREQAIKLTEKALNELKNEDGIPSAEWAERILDVVGLIAAEQSGSRSYVELVRLAAREVFSGHRPGEDKPPNSRITLREWLDRNGLATDEIFRVKTDVDAAMRPGIVCQSAQPSYGLWIGDGLAVERVGATPVVCLATDRFGVTSTSDGLIVSIDFPGLTAAELYAAYREQPNIQLKAVSPSGPVTQRRLMEASRA